MEAATAEAATAEAATASAERAGQDATAHLALVLPGQVEEEADNDNLSQHMGSFHRRVAATRAAQREWADRVEAYLRTLVPWEPAIFDRFGSLVIGWCLPDSDLDICLILPQRAPLNGNAFLLHAFHALKAAAATAAGSPAAAGTAAGHAPVSRVIDARGGQRVKQVNSLFSSGVFASAIPPPPPGVLK